MFLITDKLTDDKFSRTASTSKDLAWSKFEILYPADWECLINGTGDYHAKSTY